MINAYTLGFAFNADKSRVLLIRKNRPAWQFGKLNGVGGKLREGEDALAGMAREFREETGIVTELEQWRHFATMRCPVWSVFCFAAFDIELRDASLQPGETERPYIAHVPTLLAGGGMYDALSNIPWLIALALDPGEVHGAPSSVHVTYETDAP